MNVLFLLDNTHFLPIDNIPLLVNAFRHKQINVSLGLINTLSVRAGVVHAQICDVTDDLPRGSFEGTYQLKSAEDFDLVWVKNQPHPRIYQDVFQILWMLNKKIPFVNSAEAIFNMNNKITLPLSLGKHTPRSFISNDFDELWDIFTRESDKKWVLKRTNGGGGSDVFVLKHNDSNAKALLQSMTGNGAANYIMRNKDVTGMLNTYCVIQEYIPEIAQSEKRVMLVAGKICGGYIKKPMQGEHRSNGVQGGSVDELVLTPEETALCQSVALTLKNYGLHFVGIDFCFPYVVEYNIINPGGIGIEETITKNDRSPEVIDLILNSLFRHE